MSDSAWTGLAAIAAGLFAAVATVFQAKFSTEKAVKIALLEGDVKDLISDNAVINAENQRLIDENRRLREHPHA